MIIIQDKVHTETPCTTDFLSRRTLFLSLPPLQLPTLPPQHFFFWKEQKTTADTLLKKGAVFLLSDPPGFSQLFGGQPGSLGQSTMVWTENFCYVQGRGDSLFSLTWQPNESPECWTEFTLKVTLRCRLPYLGERTMKKNILLITSWPWIKGENISYPRLPPWCTYFFMYPYEHMITMECKEVCIPGEVQVLGLEKKIVF